jgi:hypothetical protein
MRAIAPRFWEIHTTWLGVNAARLVTRSFGGGADVTPFFTQDQGDLPAMTQPQARVIRPKGSAAFPPLRSGHPGALVILVRHMGHEMFERFLLHGLPGPGARQDQAPAACRIGLVPVLDHAHVRLGTLGSIPAHDHQLGPPRGDKRAHHLAHHGICTALPRVALGQHEPKAHREALAVPCRPQQDEAQAKKPGMRLPDTPCVDHGMLRAACVSVAAIAKAIQDAVRRGGPGGHEILRQPAHEERPVPIGGFAHASKAPRGDGGWRPPGHLCQGRAPGRDGLHKEEPAQDEPRAPAPHRGHAAKDHGHKARQRGAGDQQGQSPLQRRERENSYRWKCSCRLYTFCH